MSKRIDMERAEDMRAARIEAGKDKLRFAQLVLTAYAEGKGLTETAQALGRSQALVWRWRVLLGLQTGRQHRGGERINGRLDTLKALEEVLP